jgi:hypothetical protein
MATTKPVRVRDPLTGRYVSAAWEGPTRRGPNYYDAQGKRTTRESARAHAQEFHPDLLAKRHYPQKLSTRYTDRQTGEVRRLRMSDMDPATALPGERYRYYAVLRLSKRALRLSGKHRQRRIPRGKALVSIPYGTMTRRRFEKEASRIVPDIFQEVRNTYGDDEPEFLGTYRSARTTRLTKRDKRRRKH